MKLLNRIHLRIVLAFVTLLITAGCAEKGKEPSLAKSPPPKTQESLSDVLIQVNEAKLTRGQIEMEVERLLARYADRMPPEQIESVKDKMRNAVVERFINQTLVSNEIRKRNIKVSKKDEEKEYEKIRTMLPEEMTLEQFTNEMGSGKEQMREMIRSKITFEKLLADHTTDVDISEEEISDFCKKNKDGLIIPESVHARHILIAVAPDDDNDAKAEKNKKAGKIRKELLDGADFAELARKHSDCPSREMGGDLGTFKRGQMVKSFEDAAFSQKVNAIGPVIETSSGLHIIQVMKHDETGAIPRKKVANMLKEEKRQKAMRNLIEELKKKAEIKDYRKSKG